MSATGVNIGEWAEYYDQETKNNFYYNTRTEETSWDKPILIETDKNNEEKGKPLQQKAQEINIEEKKK